MAIEERNTYIEDDWNDDALEDRSGSEEGYFLHPSDNLLSADDVEAGDVLKGVYRPDWETVTGSQNPGVTDSRLEHDFDASTVYSTASNFTTGDWSMDFKFTTLGNDFDHLWLYFIYQDSDNHYRTDINDGGSADEDSLSFDKVKDGDQTREFRADWSTDEDEHTTNVTRDSFGNFEYLIDGSSKGTVTDGFLPNPTELRIEFSDSGGGSYAWVDNLEVK